MKFAPFMNLLEEDSASSARGFDVRGLVEWAQEMETEELTIAFRTALAAGRLEAAAAARLLTALKQEAERPTPAGEDLESLETEIGALQLDLEARQERQAEAVALKERIDQVHHELELLQAAAERLRSEIADARQRIDERRGLLKEVDDDVVQPAR